MANITKTFRFEGAHMLPGHKGKCAHLHGHSYQFTVLLTGSIKKVPTGYPLESNTGMIVDYYDVSEIVKPLIAKYLDHQYLNETLCDLPRTTAELIACWIFGALYKAKLPVTQVTVNETDSSSAVAYFADWVDNNYYPEKTDQEVAKRAKAVEEARRHNEITGPDENKLIISPGTTLGDWSAAIPAEIWDGLDPNSARAAALGICSTPGPISIDQHLGLEKA